MKRMIRSSSVYQPINIEKFFRSLTKDLKQEFETGYITVSGKHDSYGFQIEIYDSRDLDLDSITAEELQLTISHILRLQGYEVIKMKDTTDDYGLYVVKDNAYVMVFFNVGSHFGDPVMAYITVSQGHGNVINERWYHK